ncbi:Hsp20/alpha crystallin family protein [bacterium]|nr:Hsp20/alpha crystallin family protein [bacterium]
MKKKRSLFERLTGSVIIDDEIEEVDEHDHKTGKPHLTKQSASTGVSSLWLEEQAGEGELALDVYQTASHVIVRTMIPGVKREDVEISLSRDILTIKGSRKEESEVSDQDYFHKELYWGSFSRSIVLPHEVDIERAEATENQGLLTIRLPKVDKERQTKLRVKSL